MTKTRKIISLLCVIILVIMSLLLSACGDGYEKDIDYGTPNIQNRRVAFWATNTSETNIYGVSFVVEIYDTSSKSVLSTVKTDRHVLKPGAKAFFTAPCQYSGGFGIAARVKSMDIGRYADE